MPPILSQDGRFISISTPLGSDELLLMSMSGAEHLSRPFSFQLEMLSHNNDIDPNDIVGSSVDITVAENSATSRVFNGYINQFVAGERHSSGHRIYQAELVPWLYLLSYYTDNRIFQQSDAKTIIENVFQSRGFNDFEFQTQRTFRQREYTVQYRESDFRFVSRLLEEEGIFYYFRHEGGKHTLVLGDSVVSYHNCEENEARYFESGGFDDHLNDWFRQRHLIPGKWSQSDYNFLIPSTSLLNSVTSIVDLPAIANFENYGYPGAFIDRDEGEALTRIRMEEEETKYHTVFAAGTYRSFLPGGTFTLTRHEIAEEQDQEYVITTISHYMRENSYDRGRGGAFDYHNKFQCIPSDIVFRPPSKTPKPIVHGLQTALVVGPSGEEIYTDEHGRIKVQFHWDRIGEKNENSSCWIRVMQQWAGKKWGAQFLPRIGHEVVVSFLEGDPDQPLVVGSVYNEENKPPYDLPANKTQSGWKSRSSTGGSPSNYNEIRFEDKKGSESITIHAEKDFSGSAKHNYSFSAGNDGSYSTKGNNSISIDGDETRTVKGNCTSTVQGNDTEMVNGNQEVSIDGNYAGTVSGDKSEQVLGSLTIGVTGTEEYEVSGDATRTIGGSQTVSISGNLSDLVSGNASASIDGNNSVIVGGNYSLEAANISITGSSEITLTVGGSSIKIDPAGITISAPKITSAAQAINEISGATVKLN
ncbi:MAG: type VI secretion system tip protein VgrG [Gammaproteobacteria bacterium]|nr:type VI secretion system tip protein VgrG [Gammaproteobacteria bacterium]